MPNEMFYVFDLFFKDDKTERCYKLNTNHLGCNNHKDVITVLM